MEFEDIRSFLESNHRAIVQTIRPNGAVHASAVVCGAYEGYMALASVYPRSQKVRNLRRNPQCTVLCITPDWRTYVVVEGQAELKGAFNTDPEELRPAAARHLPGLQRQRAPGLGGVRRGDGQAGLGGDIGYAGEGVREVDVGG